jgi:hypothetical protein
MSFTARNFNKYFWGDQDKDDTMVVVGHLINTFPVFNGK